jgi:glucose uptake protein
MLCLGTWANTQKISKWRYELYYYDFALGALLCAVVAAFTLGSFHSQDLTFQDTLLIAGKRQMAFAAAGGLLFNVANMLLMGSMQAAGMSVAFPMAYGIALSIGAISTYFNTRGANALLLFSGAVLGFIAVAVAAYTYGNYSETLRAPAKPVRPDPRTTKAAKPRSAAPGIALALLSGVVLSLATAVTTWAREDEGSLNSYALALLFAGGMMVSTIILGPFFMAFPVQGSPVAIKNYFGGKLSQHLWGMVGGIIFMAGVLCALASYTVPATAQPDLPLIFGLQQGSVILAALCGVLLWREFKGALDGAGVLLAAMLVLLAAGIGVTAVAPLYMK